MKQFTKSCRSMIENVGMKKYFSFYKIPVNIILYFFFIIVSLTSISKVNAQGTPPPYCTTCTAEDIKFVGVDIIADNTGCYDPATNVTGKFRFTVNVTAKQRYGLIIYFEIWVNGNMEGKYYACIVDTFDQGIYSFDNAKGYPSFPVPKNIPPGQIMIKNMFTAWDNQYPDLVCEKTTYTGGLDADLTTTFDNDFTVDCFHLSPKCKFYAEVPSLNLAVKPSVSLASIMPAICPGVNSTSLSFTNRSNGADEYKIAYDIAANRAGFADLAYQLLGQSPITIAVSPTAPSGVYNGVLSIRNTTTGCESMPYDFTVTVKDNVFVATDPSVSKTFCTSGPGPDLNVVAGGEGPYTYQWYANSTSSNSGGMMIDGATTNSYSPSVSAVGTSYYYAVLNGGCGPAVNSNPVSILVNKNTLILDGGNPVSNTIYCQGETSRPLTVSADGASLTFQWYKNNSNSNAGGTAIPNAISNNYSPSTTADGTLYYYVVVSGACGTVTSTPAIVVTKKSTSIITHPSGATYCSSSTPADLQVGADGYNLKYQWYSNTANGTAGATAIAAATNAAYKPSVSNEGTMYYFAKVMGDCGEVFSNPASIIVDPNTQIATQPAASAVYCKNSAAGSLNVVGTGKNLTYQWYSNSNNSTVGGTAISAAITASYTPPTINDGTMYYYVVVGGACGTANSSVASVLVNKLTRISGHPTGSTYCPTSTPVAMTVTAEGTGLNYQWYFNNSNSTVGGTAITGALNSTYTPSVIQAGTKYYYVSVSGSCGTVNSDLATIVVDPPTQINTQPASTATYCRNASATALSVVASGKSLTYQWYSSNINSTVNATAISAANTSSYTPPTVTNGTLYYFVMVSGQCGSVASSLSSIIVNRTTEIRTQIEGGKYCEGQSAPYMFVGAIGTSVKYQWYSNVSNSTVGGTAVGVNSFTYTPSTNPGSPKYYYVVVNGTCGSVTSSVATIELAKNTIINNSLTNREYCQDASASDLNITADGEQLTYQWYANTVSSTTDGYSLAGQTNANFTPPTNNAGTMYYFVVVKGFCGQPQISNIANVLVKGRPVIQTQPSGNTYCKDVSASNLSVIANGTGLSYQWFSNSVNSTVGAAALGTDASQTVGTSIIGTTYYYVLVTGACSPSVNSNLVSVSVVEKAEITKQPTGFTLCRTAEGKSLTVEATGVGKTFEWYRSYTGAEGSFTMIQNASSASYTPDVSVVGTMYYYVLVKSTSCGNVKSNTVSVMVTDCGAFCTYTQGYFGNDGGTSFYMDASGCKQNNTYNTIAAGIEGFGKNIEGVKTITFGSGFNKLIIRNTPTDINKLIDLLPGGGTSGVIGGDYTLQTIGSLNNSLLAQTITLALNLGLNNGGNMIGYPLQAKYLKTEKAKQCGKEGGYGTFDCSDFTMLSNDIDVDGMDGLTINDVWIAANRLLAGETVNNIDHAQMTAIVDALNKAWDECRISIEWSDSKASCSQAYTLANNGIEAFAYPNPFVSKVNISFKSLASGNATIQLFDITGRKLGFIYRPNVIAGTTNVVEYNVPLNSPSVIFYRVTIGDKFASGKAISASRL